MREIRLSGSMSGVWKRNYGKGRKSGTVKAKLAETEMPHLLLPRHISTLQHVTEKLDHRVLTKRIHPAGA